MHNVLVSGAQAQVSPVASALRDRGATVTEVTDLDDVPAACAAAGPAAFDSYVQLPASFEIKGATAIARVHHFYAAGVLARFSALDAALPALTRDARITFVLGKLPPEVATREDREARYALTQVLARAAQADTPDGHLSIRVVNSRTPAGDIALLALGRRPTQREIIDSYADLSDEDLRVELMGLVFAET
jgi:hypothetical protein